MTTNKRLARYEKDDPGFKDDLAFSKNFVWMAARWLSDQGYTTYVNPTFVRPDIQEMGDYSDSGDLGIMQRIEVKHRPNIFFTSAEDFPYKTAIVDVCHAWDNARPKPYAYLIFSGDGNYFMVVKGATFKSWIKTFKYDNVKNRQRAFYECPIELCEFHKNSD